MKLASYIKLITIVTLYLTHTQVFGGTLNIAQQPLSVSVGAPPLTMLIVGKDHKLYYEAYNDASDLNDDDELDINYQGYHTGSSAAKNIDYYGYFNSYACYDYDTINRRFVPKYVKTTAEKLAKDKTCDQVPGDWSGDFLNYITMSRMDIVRKVLYGGYRQTDTKDLTLLERSFIPQDAHTWGKEINTSGSFDISKYTPLSEPQGNKRHLLANVSLSNTGAPLLRVIENSKHRIWEWVSKEKPVAGDQCIDGMNGPDIDCTDQRTDYEVRVEVCKEINQNGTTILSDTNCNQYGSSHKPTGLLHQFGENDTMHFGLMTGSFTNNTEGGVLRKPIGSFKDEINSADGTFTSVNGIVNTLNALRILDFKYTEYVHDCYAILSGPMNNGRCTSWGNPIAEMMYETLRYFSGKNAPTPQFSISGTNNKDAKLSLPVPAWNDPYASASLSCAKPFQLIISDINPSYDSNSIPGSYFNPGFTGDIPGLNAKTLADEITAAETGVVGPHFIGQSQTLYDTAPTPKNVMSLGSIRGLAPEEPTKEGSYYAASMAYYGKKNDIRPDIPGKQSIETFVVAVSSPLPRIEIPISGSQKMIFVPFAKTPLLGQSHNSPYSGFHPTNQIVDFYVEEISHNKGSFLINFEDMEQGNDHDMDAISRYSYKLNGNNTVELEVESLYGNGMYDQHMGYVLSGSTSDGIYLEVKDVNGLDALYELDTPSDRATPNAPRGSTLLNYYGKRTFTPGVFTGASFLKDPLWYAAKWGGFVEKASNENFIPEGSEWDANGNGDPDNYFLATNALKLSQKMREAFIEILKRSGSASAVAATSGTLNTQTLFFQAGFDAADWSGRLTAYSFGVDYASAQKEWDAGPLLTQRLKGAGAVNQRTVITYDTDLKQGTAFRWMPGNNTGGISDAQKDLLTADLLPAVKASIGPERLDYLRGDQSKEVSALNNNGKFRKRNGLLGDVANSFPLYIDTPLSFYMDNWVQGQNTVNTLYTEFRTQFKNRTPMVAVGANDGMLHLFRATKRDGSLKGGDEILAYVPGKLYNKLDALTDPNYIHKPYVDGKLTYSDVQLSDGWQTLLLGSLGTGGQGLFLLNVTDPDGLVKPQLSFKETNAQKLVKWEFTDADDADLGYVLGKPTIARIKEGNKARWVAIFGNGMNNTEPDANTSVTGNAVLYIVDLETKQIIKKLDTQKGMTEDPELQNRPNGLSTPLLVDKNKDGMIELIYVGDLFGHLWKIDVSNPNNNQWDFAHKTGSTPKPLFVATDAAGKQLPITTRPQVTIHPGVPRIANRDDYLIFFGTGKYFETGDNQQSGQKTQSFFTVWDDGMNTVTRAQLLQQNILRQHIEGDQAFRVISDHPITWTTTDSSGHTIQVHKGWLLDFQVGTDPNQGERLISDPMLHNDRLIVTTMISAANNCTFGGESWILELDPNNGGPLSISPFDVNGDGLFSNKDQVAIDPSSDAKTFVGGMRIAGDQEGFSYGPVIFTDGVKEKKVNSMSGGNIKIISENPANKTNIPISWRELVR